MAGMGWERSYAKAEQTPLDRFKNKNRILKTFGPPGASVYDEMDGERSARDIQAAMGMDADLFSKIMNQLLADGAIREVGGGEPAPNPLPSAAVGENVQTQSAVPSYPAASALPKYPSSPASSAPPAYLPSAMPPYSPSSRPPPGIRSGASARGASGDESSAAGPARSPLEKIIFDKYGQVGLQVYTLIDGERTAEDILNETGLSESKLVEILEFMNEQGIIKLDRPLRSPQSSGAPGGPGSAGQGPAGQSSSARPGMSKSLGEDSVGFKPMVESGDASGGESLSPDALPVDVPVINSHPSLIDRARLRALLSMKFGHVGNDLLAHVDGNKDFVQLSIETSLSLRDLDIMLGELGKAGLVSFKQLNRTEVRHRYGDDGLAVYKRYGREGLLIYQMIGKAESLRDIAARTQIEPNRAVDIIIFVHRVLGLDLPVDRDMVYRYITGKG